jgi:hypothetical protein
MKKKLLITLGCSYTEGVGAYSDDIEKPLTKKERKNDLIPQSIYQLHRPNFHKEGWPIKLQKLLGYDYCINKGLGGSSTSGQAKRFIEKLEDYKNLQTEYDIFIFWLMTFPSRISFYTGGRVTDLLLGANTNTKFQTHPLMMEYFTFIENPDLDMCLEQIFYVKVINEICEKYGMNFLYGGFNNFITTNIQLLAPELKDKAIDSEWDSLSKNLKPEHLSEICDHPNAKGYTVMAENIFERIKSLHPHLVNSVPATDSSWIWDGNGKVYTAPDELYTNNRPRVK